MTTARRICVTGATGKAGRAAVRELREHGYDVLATDITVSIDDRNAHVLRADLTDYGQAAASLGLSRVVWASSETTLGLPFGGVLGYEPRYSWRDHLPAQAER